MAGGPLGGLLLAAAIDRSMARWTADRTFAFADELPCLDVAIVLGAQCEGGWPKPALADRLAGALAAWQLGRVRRFIVSGDDGARRQDEVTPMRRWLLRHGVPAGAIIDDRGCYRTIDSIDHAAAMGVTNALICTQRNHLPRALFLAADRGIHAVGLVANRRMYSNARYDRLYEAASRSLALFDALIWRRSGR